jgi:Xaa-Pro aminopeptidase
MMDLSRMTAEEIAWVNHYHAWVFAEIAPLLNDEEAVWLKDKCKEINV